MKNTTLGQADKLDWVAQAWSASVEQLSHVMATKMATLQLKQQGLQKIIPVLLKGYRLSVEHHLMEDEISEKSLNRLENMQFLDEQLTPMFELLKNLNEYSDLMARYDLIQEPGLSAQLHINQFMSQYAFEPYSQRDLVKWDCSQDFEFKCPLLFIETSLHHLLTAALQRIVKIGQGEVSIWTSDEGDYNIFNVKETSTSLCEDQLPSLFNYFLFEPIDKTRPGLGLCRAALIFVGGDIVVDATSSHVKIMLPKISG